MIAKRIHVEDADAAGVRVKQPAGHPDRRRLARTVGADQAEHLAALDRQRQVVHGPGGAEGFRDPLEQDRAHGWNGISASTGMPDLRTPPALSTDTFSR